jgi:hypothetical protein
MAANYRDVAGPVFKRLLPSHRDQRNREDNSMRRRMGMRGGNYSFSVIGYPPRRIRPLANWVIGYREFEQALTVDEAAIRSHIETIDIGLI